MLKLGPTADISLIAGVNGVRGVLCGKGTGKEIFNCIFCKCLSKLLLSN